MVELDNLSNEEKIVKLKRLKKEIKLKKDTLKKEEEAEIEREKEIEDLMKRTQLDIELVLERRIREELDNSTENKLERVLEEESVIVKTEDLKEKSFVKYKSLVEDDDDYKSHIKENYSAKKTYAVNDLKELTKYG